MISVCKSFKFDSAHFLRDYDGACARMHGHCWKFSVSIASRYLNSLGMLLDFSILKKVVNKYVVSRYDHRILNDIPPFDTVNPTAEHITLVILSIVTSLLSRAIGLPSEGGKDFSFALYDFRVTIRVWEAEESYSETSFAFHPLESSRSEMPRMIMEQLRAFFMTMYGCPNLLALAGSTVDSIDDQIESEAMVEYDKIRTREVK